MIFNSSFHDCYIGVEWKIHRKLMNPSFSFNITQKFVPIFNKHLRIMSDSLERRCDQPAFDILVDMKKLAMDMICGKYHR